MLDRIRVVLVNTSHPGNIDGAARAMKNMDLSRLVLVQPEGFPHGDVVTRTSNATDILDAARVVDTLEEALSGCSVVLGTSAHDRRIPRPLLDPRECATTCLEHLETSGKMALVFGREYAGSANEELQRCQFRVHILSDPEFGSLSLAAAAQMLTYEARMAWLAAQGKPIKMEKFESTSMLNTELVTANELELYYAHLERTLIDIGFLDPEKPRHLMSRLRRPYGHSAISKLEMNTLRRILTETQKVARGLSCKRSDG